MCLSAIFAFPPQATKSLKTGVQWAQAYQLAKDSWNGFNTNIKRFNAKKLGDHQSFVDFSTSSTWA